MDTSQYGVPQFRQRLILVALRDKSAFTWPAPLPDQITVWNAIGDLPPLKAAIGRKAARTLGTVRGPTNDFQRRMREEMDSKLADRVQDQITRQCAR